MKNKIKDVLIEAGRYEDVKEILNETIEKCTIDASFPVTIARHFNEDGSLRHYVKSIKVKEEIINLLDLIEGNRSDFVYGDFENVYCYIKSEADRDLHNFGIAATHRNPQRGDLEHMRCLLIIENLIDQFNIDLDEGGNETYYIPEGWKKEIKNIL